MDLELKKGFQELQQQAIESKSRIAQIETNQKITMNDVKVNESIIKRLDEIEPESKYIYEPVGRMLVKRGGDEAKQFLKERETQYKEKLRQFQDIKEVCTDRVKKTEDSLRELVDKIKQERK